jgi:hypothetical protein
LSIFFGVRIPFRWNITQWINRLSRTCVYAVSAVDTAIWIDEQLVKLFKIIFGRAGVNRIDWARLYAQSILLTYAGLANHVSDRHGMTQVAMMSRLVEWFANQDELLRPAVLRHYPQDIEAEVAKLILKRA